jgi:hypothetical protein
MEIKCYKCKRQIGFCTPDYWYNQYRPNSADYVCESCLKSMKIKDRNTQSLKNTPAFVRINQ